jgi:hypothetical protein
MLAPWILLPAFVGEFSLALWLTVKGIDAPKWRELAAVQQGRPFSSSR